MINRTTGFAISALVLAIGLTQASFVYADDCNKPEYQALLKIKNPDVLSRINELNLTSDQKNKFKVMKSNFDAENKINGATGKSINVQLNQIATSSTIDEARLDSIVSDAKKNMVIGQVRTATLRHNLYNLLNDQQKIKYHELQQQEEQSLHMSLQCPDIAKKTIYSHDLRNQVENLDLTEEQKSKIMPIISAFQDQIKKIMLQLNDSAMGVNQMEAQIVQSTSPIDSAKLQDFAMAQAETMAENIRSTVMTYHNIYENLNVQQKAQFMKIISK